LLDLTDTTVTLETLGDEEPDNDADTFIFTLAANDPWIKSFRSTFTLTDTMDEFIGIGPDEFGSTFPGIVFIGEDSIFTVGNDLLRLEGTVTATATDAQLQFTGTAAGESEVNIGGRVIIISGADPSPSWTLSGPLLTATKTKITVDDGDDTRRGEHLLAMRDTATLIGPSTGDALFSFDDNSSLTDPENFSSLTNDGNVFSIRRSLDPTTPTTLELGGPLLIANNSTFDIGGSIVSQSESAELEGNGTEALFQFNSSTFDIEHHFLRLDDTCGNCGNPGTPGAATVTLEGSLLFAENNTTLKVGTDSSRGGDLITIRDGSQLIMNTSKPVVELSGGTLTVGTDEGTTDTRNHLFFLEGVDPDGDGIGTRPIEGSADDAFSVGTENAELPIGTLLKATDGATITVKRDPGDMTAGGSPRGGTALRLDTALLEATLPIIELLRSSLLTDGGVVSMLDSKVISNSAFVALRDKSEITTIGRFALLDNSLITVKDALIDLKGGSIMKIGSSTNLQDLLRLTNGSIITVVDGPLIRVDGKDTLLEISRRLVNFGGTGGNKIVVKNSLCEGACVVKRGIQVLESGTGSISIDRNPIGNGALGSIDPSSTSAAIIQATDGGEVKIGL